MAVDLLPPLACEQEWARRRLLEFIRYTYPEFEINWFHEEVCARLDAFLQAVRERRSPRLMLFAPPRHGKTEMVSRRFPAFALGRLPNLQVIAASYASDLASRINRDVQRVMESQEYGDLFPDSKLWGKNIRAMADGSYLRNSDIFEVVGHRGTYRAAGVGGGITGMGADILLIDDPIKDAEQAYSKVYRDKVWEWYTSTAYTRLMPGGGVLIILTRWHSDDLAGRLLKAAQEGGEPYEIVSFPAIAERDEAHRKMGECLDPRFPLAQLENIKSAVGSRVWAALYQQTPTPTEGGLIKYAWFQRYCTPPANPIRIIQSWDTAMKAGDANDPSAGTTWAETSTGFYLLDVIRRRMEYPELKQTMRAWATKWSPALVLVEDKASGHSIVQDLRQSSNIPILPVNPTSDKVVRLMSVSALFEGGRVFLPETAHWLADYEAELVTFPNGAHDDQVDSTSQALSYLSSMSAGYGAFEWMRREAELAQRELDEEEATWQRG